MSTDMIVVQGLKKRYKSGEEEVYALRGVDFRIKSGESVAVMGPSGSGKSTLLSIIGALNSPSAGKVFIDGIDVYSLSKEKQADFRREYLGFVFQQFQLISYLTALENVLLPLTTTPLRQREKRQKAEKALVRVGLSRKGQRLPLQLSGGEQERVAIARAIVNNPPLILADEPTGSLDSETGSEIMHLFRELNEGGLTILMVTHNTDNKAYMNRVITMHDGKKTSDCGVTA